MQLFLYRDITVVSGGLREGEITSGYCQKDYKANAADKK